MHNRANQKRGPTRQLPGVPNYTGRYDVTGIIGNIVLVDSGFLYAEDLPRKLSAIWVRTYKWAGQPCHTLKQSEEYRRRNISLPVTVRP
jgi:hypothetical protein